MGESVQTEITAHGDRTLRRDYDAESQNSLSSSSFSNPPTTSVNTGWGGQSEQTGQGLANGSLQHSVIEPDVGPPSTGQYVGTVYHDVPASIFNTPTDLELLDIGLNAHEPAWLLGSDFDLNALDFPLSTAISEWGHPNPDDLLSHQDVHDSSNALGRPKGHMALSDLVPAVQYNWYTTLTRDVVCYESPEQLYGQDQIDEAYREGLRCKLQPNPSNTALPSADFLVSSNP